jgi:hypothetical protein
MDEFELYQKEVTIVTRSGEKKFLIQPLSGKHLPKLYSSLKTLRKARGEGDAVDPEKILEALDEPTVEKLHFACLETMKKVSPSTPLDTLDMWVSQNFLQLFPVVIEVNFGNVAEE